MNTTQRNLWLVALITISLIVIFNLFQGPGDGNHAAEINYSTFLTEVDHNQVKEVTLKGDIITGKRANGQNFVTKIPSNVQIATELSQKGVQVEAAAREREMPSLLDILISWFPMLLLVGVWVFLFRQMHAGGGKAMGFGKSKARLLDEKKGRVTFKDVAGIEEAKQDVMEIVEFLRDPQKFQRLGGKIPKGVLLVGPPGTGKTLLARAIAGEAGVPFFSISGSDFVEMFVGVGASRVRDMFEQAKKGAPCIIFIDEIDAVGRHRGAGLGGGNDEREQTLNQLLVEMDGFADNEGVIVIAATNRPDVLDPALLRPGRFDRQIIVPNPDVKGREEILNVHLKNVPLSSDVEPRIIARGTPGFSGADLANLVNEAALLAARRGRRVVTMSELEEAKDKVMMGAERRSMVMTEDEKKLTAYHEGGHALVGHYLPDSDPIHKATIVPRGRALGMVMRLPENDRLSVTRSKLEADIAVAMGGRIAEEMIFGADKITTGASSDIKMATELARRMVTEWGMSDKLGPLTYGQPQQEIFLGHSVTQTQNISNETSKSIDSEVRRIVDAGYQRAKEILVKHIEGLHLLARNLLEYETLSGEEIEDILAGKELKRAEARKERTVQRKRSSLASTPKTPPLAPEPQPGI
jgi:cell division protease FtsH